MCKEIPLLKKPLVVENVKHDSTCNALSAKKGLNEVLKSKEEGKNCKSVIGGASCFSCTSCSRVFTVASHLASHEWTHAHRKNKCPRCKETIAQRPSLIRHVQNKHHPRIWKDGTLQNFTSSKRNWIFSFNLRSGQKRTWSKGERMQENSWENKAARDRRGDFKISDPGNKALDFESHMNDQRSSSRARGTKKREPSPSRLLPESAPTSVGKKVLKISSNFRHCLC